MDTPTAWFPESAASATYLEDSVLVSRVKAALILSPLQTSMHLGVDARQGVVLLSGRVNDTTERDLAVFVAQSVRGVRKVDSFIFVPGIAYVAADRLPQDDGLTASQDEREEGGAEPTLALSSPLPLENASPSNDGRTDIPAISPMTALAYSLLGIVSIQDELRIKP